jgi:type IV pilus assembly protein PilN
MIRINLLPVREERRKADLRQFAMMLGATCVGTLLVVGLFHLKLSGDVREAQAAVAETQRQIDAYKPQLKQVEEYRKTKAEIEKKLEVIERLDASRSGPVHVFDELATHAPARLWITKISAHAGQISVAGMSLDNELVALFLTALNESPYFDEVELRETKAKEMSGFKLNEFKLSAKLVSPVDSEKKASDDAIASVGSAR